MLSFNEIDPMAIAAAVFYFLGIYFHNIHIKTVFHLLDRYEELNANRALFSSLFWPTTVLSMLWVDLFDREEEE